MKHGQVVRMKNEGTSSQLMHGPIQGPLSLMNSEGFDIKAVMELFGLEEVWVQPAPAYASQRS